MVSDLYVYASIEGAERERIIFALVLLFIQRFFLHKSKRTAQMGERTAQDNVK